MDAYDFSAEKELLLLCLKNKLTKVKKLLQEKKVNLNWRNLHGETAIYFAARHKGELAMTLLRMGADPTIRTGSNQSILHQIGISGNLELLKAIFDKVPDARRLTYGEVRSWDGLSPVHLVAKHGHQDVLEEFQVIGLGLSVKSWAGATALHYTIAFSRFSSTLFLFDQNVGVNSRTYSFGFMLRKPHSPLHILLHWPEVDSKNELYEKVLTQMILRRARIRGCRACKAKEPCNLFAAERLPRYHELKQELKPMMTTRGGSLIGMFKKRKGALTPPMGAKGGGGRDESVEDDDDDDDDDLKDIEEDKMARVRAVSEHSARA